MKCQTCLTKNAVGETDQCLTCHCKTCDMALCECVVKQTLYKKLNWMDRMVWFDGDEIKEWLEEKSQ